MYIVIIIIWIILRKYFIMETNIINKEIPSKTKSNSNELSPEYSGLDVQHNKLDIGGPTSAFSSLYSHAVSNKDTGKNQTYGVHSYEDISKFEHRALETNFFQEKKSGIFQDIPVAPAFVQIYQRRRRRENRPRRQRTTFTSEQTLKLELEYGRADYITRPRRYELAEILNLSESQIKIWFQNRRAKDKRIEKAHMDHQLRAMGFPHFHGQYPFPVPNPGYCGGCVSTPTPLPFLQPLCPTAQAKPFQLL